MHRHSASHCSLHEVLIHLFQWDRFTFSRLTTFYIIFSVLHCIIQVAFQVKAFTINAAAASFLYSVLIQGNASNGSFPILGDDLRMCDEAASNMKTTLCRVIWSPNHPVSNISNNQQAQTNPLFDVTSAASTASGFFTSSPSTSISTSSASSLSAVVSSLSSTTTTSRQSTSQKASSTTSQAKVTVTVVVQPSVAAVDNNAGSHGTQSARTSIASSPSPTTVPAPNNGDNEVDDDDDDNDNDDEYVDYYSRLSVRSVMDSNITLSLFDTFTAPSPCWGNHGHSLEQWYSPGADTGLWLEHDEKLG